MSEQAFDKQRMKRSWDPVSRLDVVPSRRDRLAGIGVAVRVDHCGIAKPGRLTRLSSLVAVLMSRRV